MQNCCEKALFQLWPHKATTNKVQLNEFTIEFQNTKWQHIHPTVRAKKHEKEYFKRLTEMIKKTCSHDWKHTNFKMWEKGVLENRDDLKIEENKTYKKCT